MSTRGLQFLNQKGIACEVVTYDHQEKGAQFAARATGFPLSQTIKTLVVCLDAKTYVLVLMSGDRDVSMKKIAKAYGAKRAEMADAVSASRLTGYRVGGISPFGTKKRLPVMMEAGLQQYPEVMINAGQRGIMVKLDPADIVLALEPTVADLSH
jgi:Cys-tRNA(Pro)/Cys-tRNA(Cys) deacylase